MNYSSLDQNSDYRGDYIDMASSNRRGAMKKRRGLVGITISFVSVGFEWSVLSCVEKKMSQE